MNKAELIPKMRSARFHNIYGEDAYQAFSGGDVCILQEKQSAAALSDEGKFMRTYWCIQDHAEVFPLCEKIKQASCGKPFVSEVIYREDSPPETIQSFIRAGLEEYAHLVYMTRKPAPLTHTSRCPWDVEKLCCARADVKDIDALYQLLAESFDPLISHLPTRTQITDCIQAGGVSIVQGDGDKICSAALFEKTGSQTQYLFQLVTAPDERKKGWPECCLRTG